MFLTFKFWNYYFLKLLRLETITFSDATLSDINIVLSYVLSQYQLRYFFFYSMCKKYKPKDNGLSVPILLDFLIQLSEALL